MDGFQVDAVTIGAWGVNFFTVVEGLGLFSQIREIWRKRSGASVSVGMMLFLSALCTSAVVYGLSHSRTPLVFNGAVLGIGFSVVAALLWKFKGYARWEKLFGIGLALSLIMMVVVGHHDRWYFMYSTGSAAALCLQPIEIWRKKSSGVVDIRLLILFEASNTFWVIYGYAVRDWVLMALCPAYVIVIGLTIVLWVIFRNHARDKST